VDAGTLSVGRIFGLDRRYVVPLFQRPYVWTREDQLEALWDDVRTVSERLLAGQATRPHFLGAIVLDQLRHPTGRVETRLVIDGQQRLTTIQIMLEAFADVAREKGLERLHLALVRLTRNEDPLIDDEEEAFKVWPTNLDRDVYRAVMAAKSPTDMLQSLQVRASRKRKSTGIPIADAFIYFHQAFTDWLDADHAHVEGRADVLYKALKDYLRLVVIDLGSDDDAQLIFETLNARGTPLLPSDLVKNDLFHRAEVQGENIKRLHERWWKPFEDEWDWWREEVGRGHAKRPRIDIFLQNYLTRELRDDVKLAHLYDAYKDVARARHDGRAEALMERINAFAGHFRLLYDAEAGGPLAAHFQRLQAMEMNTANPFLLEVLERFGREAPETRAILAALESFLVRRMVCQLSARSYGMFFVEALKLVDAGETDVSASFVGFLMRSDTDTARWPNDAEFRDCWMTLPTGSQGRVRIEMLLLALEARVATGKTERVRIDGSLTVEHLMPREWTTHWAPPEGPDASRAIAERQRLIQTMGNLTLLTDKLNPSVSNGPWDRKLAGIREHSILKLNLELAGYGPWGEAAIRKRGERLFELAREIWPRPGAG
jgi:hypothetical protein